MPALTTSSLLSDLAGLLKVAVNELPAYWQTTLEASHAAAQQEILGRLLNRGFSQAQVEAWDRRAEFERDLTLYWALVRGGVSGNYELQSLQALDRRAELDKVLVFASGVWVRPAAGGPGLVVTAGPSVDGGIFNWPDPDAGETGDYTRW